MSLPGVVLVTGVGQGFGRAIALGWGRVGYDVVCADRDVAMASKTAAEVEEVGGQAIPIQIDVTLQLDVRNAFDKVDQLFGGLDGIVHVATRASGATGPDLTDGEFSELVDDTLRSSQWILRTATRRLERAWMVVVAPPASATAPQNAMVRGGLARLCRAYGQMHGRLRANVVVPSRPASDPPHDARVVDTVLWLGSEAASGVAGQEVTVDLPKPPRVIETLLPEIQAALDDRVRQSDLEADVWRGDGPEGDGELDEDEASTDEDGDDLRDGGEDADAEYDEAPSPRRRFAGRST
ncbi:MAG: SDR family oxidoreductase [Trueperaceae bacterium]|nr:SDR family oxidoreductase [Trueperaceae bacterium]